MLALLSFATSGLLADVFLRLVPQVLISSKTAGLIILLGILLCFLFEKCFRSSQFNEEHKKWLVTCFFLVVNVLHLSIDRFVLHTLVHVFDGWVILLFTGWTPREAIQWQLFSALISLLVPRPMFVLPLLIGVFIYIATVHLMPALIDAKHGWKDISVKFTTLITSLCLVLFLGTIKDQY